MRVIRRSSHGVWLCAGHSTIVAWCVRVIRRSSHGVCGSFDDRRMVCAGHSTIVVRRLDRRRSSCRRKLHGVCLALTGCHRLRTFRSNAAAPHHNIITVLRQRNTERLHFSLHTLAVCVGGNNVACTFSRRMINSKTKVISTEDDQHRIVCSPHVFNIRWLGELAGNGTFVLLVGCKELCF